MPAGVRDVAPARVDHGTRRPRPCPRAHARRRRRAGARIMTPGDDDVAIRSRIRTIPDYPKPGIMFRDITTLIGDPVGLRLAVDRMVSRYEDRRIDKIAGIESRGFIFGAAPAYRLGE